MIKILFLIHDLGQGGAEKVLVNLVNHLDHTKFEVTVMTLFDCGENRQFLNPNVTYKTWRHKMFPGNSHVMKLWNPEKLHNMIIKEHYDVEVAYLEGPCARIISGCPDHTTKLISWIHIEQYTTGRAAASFRSVREATECYNRFDQIICVSETVKEDFKKVLKISAETKVIYNTNDTGHIAIASRERVEDVDFPAQEFKIVGVGKLLKSKGFDRILRITEQLRLEGYPVHTYILGEGPEEENLKKFIRKANLQKHVTLLGYKMNPYKYVAQCDLFVCASYAEGFSTAATEALIVGTPVCTVDVSGMKEMLGMNNEYGIVTANEQEALYQGIKRLLDSCELMNHYKKQVLIRGNHFDGKKAVKEAEDMFTALSL